MFKADLERKPSEQDVILKAVIASIKHLKTHLRFLLNEEELQDKSSEELVKKYGGKRTEVRGGVEKLVKRFATSFLVICNAYQ